MWLAFFEEFSSYKKFSIARDSNPFTSLNDQIYKLKNKHYHRKMLLSSSNLNDHT